MSSSSKTTDLSVSNFGVIFDAASKEYVTLTKKDLATHPFAAAIQAHNSPDSILNVFRNQARAFDTFRKGGDKLMTLLTPIVNILFTFSGTLGEGVGLVFSPAKTIFTGIGVLLGAVKDVIANYEALVNLFERIQFFLQRLDRYTAVPLTPEMTLLLGKIMAQVLSVLALSTKEMKERRISASICLISPFIADYETEKFMKRLVGRTDVEDALARLDMLTKEENLMTVARNLEVTHRVDVNVTATQELTHDVDDKVTAIKEVIHHVDDNAKATREITHLVDDNVTIIKEVVHDVDGNVKETKELTQSIHEDVKLTKHAMDEQQRKQIQVYFRTWLSPPNPSINHNVACDIQHEGTAMWFIQGSKFDEWKKKGSLLWIRGNPGSGKSILCSAIIKNIKHMQESRSALVAYYYFDFKDVAKRDLRGLLASILLQLVDDSDGCWDAVHQLYTACHDGSEQPSEAALTQCLGTMIDLPEQIPIYIIFDALDECPNDSGTPSAREKVLNFVQGLFRSNHPNLFVCITSRPEQDIGAALDPLTSSSNFVSLHDEGGQRQDIDSYVRSFVHTDAAMRRWRAEDKELVISALPERAAGMFRWVYCQLDTLRRCMPSSIRKSLNELPITLDDTYERMLQGIPKEKFEHASRLFQCMVAAVRPLRVKELAELFAIEFGADNAPNLVASWRPENAEEAVLSTCSTFITIIDLDDGDDEGSKIVQFSHFSVKEFLTSNRLQTSHVVNIRQYYIPLAPAHAILARACVTVLMQLEDKDEDGYLRELPLASYATTNWVRHAQFEDVASRIQDSLAYLFDPQKPHFKPRILLLGVKHFNPGFPGQFDDNPDALTPLCFVAACGFSGLVRHLIRTHALDVNAKSYPYGISPLHAASFYGHVNASCILLDHGANANGQAVGGATPLHYASFLGHPRVVQLLLEHKAISNARFKDGDTPLLLALSEGYLEIVRLLLDYGADVAARGSEDSTPYQLATRNGYDDIAKLLLEHGAEGG